MEKRRREGGAGKDVSRGKSVGRRGEVRKIKRRDAEDVRTEEIKKESRKEEVAKRRRVKDGGEGESV